MFDDGFTKILKHCKLSKIKDPNNIPLPPKAPVPHAAPLFEPVVGSKEDRRERKRKINVAQLFGRKKSKSDDPYMRFEDEEKYDLPEIIKSKYISFLYLRNLPINCNNQVYHLSHTVTAKSGLVAG